ncbi:hypothetical protein [Leisingera daeponensis]|uniref:hypothetical protein n=1 Tax=Leisingera daeponensis TaxID=405746 RepID=UPI001C94C433|nr:hypothetical protein [Leisingera daeponensis]MBY6056792.1 hypothetical protein [Leisingera daeponensis]
MAASRQQIYAAVQDMQDRDRFSQAMLLWSLGGKITPGSIHCGDRFDFDAMQWHVALLNISASGENMPSALDAWIRAARLFHTLDGSRRATDGRPDCPYSGQAPLTKPLPASAPKNKPFQQLA